MAETSQLSRCCDLIRAALDEPSIEAKYKNPQLIRWAVQPAIGQVFTDLFKTSDTQIGLRFDLALVSNQEYYQLPPNIRRVIRMGTMNSEGFVDVEVLPRSEYSAFGPGWAIEANTLRVSPPPIGEATWIIFYHPGGDIRVHEGLGSKNALDATKFTLASTPTLGERDTRANCYAGAMLRIIDDATGLTQERVIASYDAATRIATVRQAFSPALTGSDGAIGYEISPPPAAPAFYDAVALRAALRVLTFKKGSADQQRMMAAEYMTAAKTMHDTFVTQSTRIGRRFQFDTVNNADKAFYGVFDLPD